MNAPVNTRRDLLLAGGFTLAFTLVRGGRAEAMVSPTSQAGDPAAAKADGNPAFETIRAILDGMGLRLHVTPKVVEAA